MVKNVDILLKTHANFAAYYDHTIVDLESIDTYFKRICDWSTEQKHELKMGSWGHGHPCRDVITSTLHGHRRKHCKL